MKEYIDRDALLKDICGNDPSHMEDYYFNAIANAPTADVVEVVRCKDCQRFMPYTADDLADGNDVEGADGVCYLRIVNSEDNQFCAVKNTDFCSYGERKEQE